jgi:tRNA dimethylallyltransferase
MGEQEKPVVAVIAGPTASGKTRMGVELCRAFNGEVVSADSMQIYRGIPVGTACPTEAEREGVPHHLMDFVPLDEAFSVARWCELAKQTIDGILSRGKLPVIVGGTGLYITSLMDNVCFSPSAEDPQLRERLRRRAEEEGAAPLLEELRSFDPESAARLHPNNVGRIIRAIELYRVSGVTMTEQLRQSKQEPSPYRFVPAALSCRDREQLYDRINRRVDVMLQNGLLEEARRVLQKGGHTVCQAIGYKEFAPYFAGEESLEDAAERLRQNTRRYAKRQLTWFRRDERFHWIFRDDYRDDEQWIQAAEEYLTSCRL